MKDASRKENTVCFGKPSFMLTVRFDIFFWSIRYNYPIFLNLFHTFLSIPITFLLTYYFQEDKCDSTRKNEERRNTDVETASLTTTFTDRMDPEINTRDDDRRSTSLQFTSSREQLLGNSEQSTTAATTTKVLESDNNKINVSRLIFLGSLDGVTTTLQVVATTFVPGSLLVLIPPAASTLLLHMMSVLRRRRKKRKKDERSLRQRVLSFFSI